MIGHALRGAVASLALLACRTEDVVAIGEVVAADAESDRSPGGDLGDVAQRRDVAQVDAQPEASTMDSRARECADVIPSVALPTADGSTSQICTGQLAARTFTHALCSCGDVTAAGQLSTAAYGSEAVRGGASLGVNGTLVRAGPIVIDGSLKVASPKLFGTLGALSVTGDLWLAGPGGLTGFLTVTRDTWLQQNLSFAGFATVQRDLHLAPGAGLTGTGNPSVLGTTVNGPWTLAKPCACDSAQLLDVAGLVGMARTLNDNALVGINSDILNTDAAGPLALGLPCGRFFLLAPFSLAAVHLQIGGRVALFVAGDVTVSPQFELEMAPGAELDWFISGNLTLATGARLGDSARSAAMRLYVSGTQEIHLPGTADAAFNLYAPAAPVMIDGSADMKQVSNVYGGLFARDVTASHGVSFHYDSAVLGAANACQPSGGSCERCSQCSAGAACLVNACYTCATDSDCCAPFVCVAGNCQSLN